MPISAAGRAERADGGFVPVRRSAEHGFVLVRRSAEHGFTLVELLVVLTIIAIASAAVVLAVPDPRGSVGGEAERFAARARAAQERAIMDNRPIALIASPGGYRFEWRVNDNWQVIPQKPFFPQKWGEGVSVSVTAPNGRTTFDTTGFADPMQVALARGGDRSSVDISNGGSIHVLH